MEQSFVLTENNLNIPCRLTLPPHGDIRRLVLGVHGIGGSSRDAIQEGIAEEMTFFSSAVLRFDFPAHGENPSDDFILSDCVHTLLTAARHLRERYPEVEDLCIFATGFGAYVTLVALDDLLELPGQVKLVLHTPSVRMHDTLLSMARMSKATFWAMDQITFPTARTLRIPYSFYEELEENIALTAIPIPVLILHSEESPYIRWDDIHHFRRINDGAKLVVIPGTSHQFLEEGAWDMVLDLTRDWFSFQQVLLTDWE